MPKKIAITGIGIVSSIGMNLEETRASLLNKKHGIGKITVLDSIHKDGFVLGEIKKDHKALLELAGVDETTAYSRTALLGIIAARQAYLDANLSEKTDRKTGLVSASTVGGMDRSELYYKNFLQQEASYKEYIDTHHAGNSTEMVAHALNIKDYISTISTACSSSLNSIMFGARLIKNEVVDRVVVGGTDGLSKFTLNGFNTLMILDKSHCRPFDATRAGLNLGEGAAYLVLEDAAKARAEKKHIYGLVSGYANANDAHHQTASSSDGKGPYLAMKNAIDEAGLRPEDIDYINVHGTGTENNDLTEGVAMKRLFGDQLPDFSSTKAYTGHTLGAAGVIETIISIISLNTHTIFPNINFNNTIEEIDIKPVDEVKSVDTINHILTNSFGFGGNDSSLVISKPELT